MKMRAKAGSLLTALDRELLAVCSHHATLGEISVYRITLTPEIAAKLVEFSGGTNRKLREHIVEKYANEIVRGRWGFTHQGIAFDQNGHDQDGQHRLRAVIKAGQPIETFIFTNMPEKSFKRLDQGKNRNFPDLYPSVANGVKKAALVRMVVCVAKDDFRAVVTAAKSFDLVHAFSRYLKVVQPILTIKGKAFSYSPFVGALMLAAAIDREAIEKFVAELAAPPNVPIDNPWVNFMQSYCFKRLRQHKFNIPFGEARIYQFKETLVLLTKMLAGETPPAKFRAPKPEELSKCLHDAVAALPKTIRDEIAAQ